jgi:hypothetical protein
MMMMIIIIVIVIMTVWVFTPPRLAADSSCVVSAVLASGVTLNSFSAHLLVYVLSLRLIGLRYS